MLRLHLEFIFPDPASRAPRAERGERERENRPGAACFSFFFVIFMFYLSLVPSDLLSPSLVCSFFLAKSQLWLFFPLALGQFVFRRVRFGVVPQLFLGFFLPQHQGKYREMNFSLNLPLVFISNVIKRAIAKKQIKPATQKPIKQIEQEATKCEHMA